MDNKDVELLRAFIAYLTDHNIALTHDSMNASYTTWYVINEEEQQLIDGFLKSLAGTPLSADHPH